MVKILPQIKYSDGILAFQTERATDPHDIAEQDEALVQFSKYPHSEVIHSDDAVCVQTDVNALRIPSPAKADNRDLTGYLTAASQLLPYKSATDVVLSVSTIGRCGISIDVHKSFQAWLQNGGMSEDVRADCMQATARIFGRSVMAQTKKAMETQWSVGLGIYPAEFSILVLEKSQESVVKKTGNVMLDTIAVRTIGDCACLGSAAHNRHVYFHDGQAELYMLESHNIDSPDQSLSLIIGLGALASQVPPDAPPNIFADVDWNVETFSKS